MKLALVGRDGVGRTVLEIGADADRPVSWAVRILRPQWSGPELALRVWQAGALVRDEQQALRYAPERLAIEVTVRPAGPRSSSIASTSGGLTFRLTSVWRCTRSTRAFQDPGEPPPPLPPDVSAREPLASSPSHDAAASGVPLAAPYGGLRAGSTASEEEESPHRAAAMARPGVARSASAAGFDRRRTTCLRPSPRLEAAPAAGAPLRPQAPSRRRSRCRPRRSSTGWGSAHYRSMVPRGEQRTPATRSRRICCPGWRPGPSLALRRATPADRSRYELALKLLDRWPQLYLVTSMVWFQSTCGWRSASPS